ncbi:MAG: hypothetical protein KGL46_04085 [Hyphomicrobiales bacterium]|nr:hypothetical protein [Hyphomicrobiales bacterium]
MSLSALSFKTTQAGLAAIQQPPTGIVAPFAFLAVGSGPGYEPTGAEVALKAEFMRVPLGSGQKLTPTQMSFAATLDGANVGWIAEIGLFLQDGTLWALWSQDPAVQHGVDVNGAPAMGAPLGYKAFGIPYTITSIIETRTFSLDALPVVVNGAPMTVNINRVEEHLSDLLALVVDRARVVRKLEAARRADEAKIYSLMRRVSKLEGKV